MSNIVRVIANTSGVVTGAGGHRMGRCVWVASSRSRRNSRKQIDICRAEQAEGEGSSEQGRLCGRTEQDGDCVPG